jgi:hypothetical protein
VGFLLEEGPGDPSRFADFPRVGEDDVEARAGLDGPPLRLELVGRPRVLAVQEATLRPTLGPRGWRSLATPAASVMRTTSASRDVSLTTTVSVGIAV